MGFLPNKQAVENKADVSLINGISFSGSTSIAIATAASTTLSVLLTVPTAGSGIFTLSAECDATNAGTFTFSETPSVDVSGATSIATANLNRNSATTTSGVVIQSVIFTTAGTVLENRNIGSAGPRAITQPRRLLAGGTYLARFVAANNTTTVSMNFIIIKETA